MSIEVSKLYFAYDAAPVLKDVSFHLGKGELLAVLGPNGAGKSTLFRCILGIESGYRGSVTLDGQDARSLSPRARAARIAYIPQVHAHAFPYSVEETVLMGTAHSVSPLALPGREQHASAMEAMEAVGIRHLAKKTVSRLSGGEQQLVLIARALAQRAATLMMDEPTSSLDYGNQARVLERVRALADRGYSIMLSTHNPQHALSYADRVLALHGGQAAACGTPRDVMTPALLERLYGVKTALIETETGLFIVPGKKGRENCV
ncbi:MAG: ABC transporter ATP-binding protein [Clostridiales bacterium]|nr:ABC transporter ATP-binding protein [Clostridiales bacterium]